MEQELKIRTFDELSVKEVRWLWKPYIAFGKLTVIQGNPGDGKTTLALALAALLSSKRKMPTGDAPPVSGNVLYQSGEDSPQDTIKPRLVACGADCSKIAFVDVTDGTGGLKPTLLEEAIRQTNAKLAVIDPLQAFLNAGQDISRANNIRPFLRDLGNAAERTGAAIVIIGHMNKTEKAKGLYRGLGSIDITAAARSVLLVGRKKGDGVTRFITQIKNNLAGFGGGVGFTINERGGVEFIGECDVTEEDLLTSATEYKAKLDVAKDVIRELLEDGDKTANDVYDACLKAGVKSGTISLAKKELRVRSIRKSDDWYWTLNDEQGEFGFTELEGDIHGFDSMPETPAAMTAPTPTVNIAQLAKPLTEPARKIFSARYGELEIMDWALPAGGRRSARPKGGRAKA